MPTVQAPILDGEQQIGRRAVNDIAGKGAIAREIEIERRASVGVTTEIVGEDIVNAEGSVCLKPLAEAALQFGPSTHIVQRMELVTAIALFTVGEVFKAATTEAAEAQASIKAAGQLQLKRKVDPRIQSTRPRIEAATN